ncbi:LemA-like protein [Leifsonia xyli subsp. cynodontis DSM 46306]|jgi:hypothetical protein|uniref:Uncharacterized protein n=1 Tax=Leifsonia xyli subsp. cynodontis DSM 46306 TaxID=1389489 RepID=U3P5D5_LEIXC|nr:hypothetical protein [Leifsonia xyli]AGW40971.1 LemA-like protein [Leifsonia xyli subsp. cynodontis DSM 46306]AGW42529.1 LemA-like protein [Leifsonia xyli subsp. cynodontis DSM 46306]
MLTSIHSQFYVSGDNDLDAQTDAVMEALLELEEASEGLLSGSDVTASLRERVVTISVLIEAESAADAKRIGVLALDAAVRIAGGNPTILEDDGPEDGFVLQGRTAELIGSN